MKTTRFFRRGLPLLLAVLLLTGLLTGCGSKAETPPAPSAEPTAKPALPSDEAQRQLIEANRALWAFEDPYDSPWFYTVTDLDHNGLLEILAATTQGTGVFTYAHYYEVMRDGSGLKNLYHDGVEIEGPDDWPEVIRDKLDFYYDPADDSYHYLCEGVTREGAAHQYFAWYALCLQKGVAEWELLASKEVEWLNGGETELVTCKDAQGKPITEMEYDGASAERFAGLEKRTAALFWNQVENPFEETAEPLLDEAAGPAEPVETETPFAPENHPAFHITKNPTSEALAIGGKTWFIAHADNGVEPTWQLTDPDGLLYSLDAAMDCNPGLQLEALPQGTLAVSDVPLSLNGWSVVARFDGDGGSLYTEPAYLYVGDFVSAYGSVIQKYRDAYAAGVERSGSYAMNHELSEFITFHDHVGYALKDLDKDGIPELIIAGAGGAAVYDTDAILDLYTLVGGSPKQLACTWARNRYYLRTDSLIVNEGSSGAAYSNVFLYSVSADGLTPKEGVITFFPGDDRDSCYHQVGRCDYEPQPGDERISMEEYTATWDSWKSLCYIPPLTQIA